MAVNRMSCFLNLPTSTPSPASSHPPKSTPQLPCSKNEEPNSRRLRFPSMAGLASVIIGMEMVSSVVLSSDLARHSAMAREVPFLAKPNEAVRVAKWSERRMCPQWRLNSLESVVPENLPRPSPRRRWESVGHATAAAPPLKLEVRSTGDCFSM